MPVEACQKGGRSGYRWGGAGFCHVGSGARAKAARQGRAIEAARNARADAAIGPLRKTLAVSRKTEATYRKLLQRRTKRLNKRLTSAINAKLRTLGKGIDDRAAGRTDALADAAKALQRGAVAVIIGRADTEASDLAALRGVVRATRRSWERANPVDRTAVERVARSVEASATTRTVSAVERIARTSIGIPGGSTAQILRTWTKESVDLIKTIDRRHFADVERVVEESLRVGRRTRDIRERIAERFDITERRAALIARDQLANLNGRITKARQEGLGIKRFRWTTSGDDRVREEHEAIDGEVYTWASGHPTEGFPGQPINCRCVAIPVFDADDLGEG